MTIHSTEENIKREMREAFARITGDEGDEMRKRLKEVKKIYVDSYKTGMSHVAMEKFGRFATA